MDREKTIIRTSIIGIVINVILVAFKMIIGLATNSIAIILDAVNNLGDALSSIITIVGTKLAGKPADFEHPYGYGRIEHLTSIIIACIVLFAGITSFKESVVKIIHPEPAEYTVVSLVIVGVAVVVKFFTGQYVKKKGESINASALVASGEDAFFDSILSFATLISGIVSLVWSFNLEAFLGVAISAVIIKAGVETLVDTLNEIIGNRIDKEFSQEIKKKVRSYPGVIGAYDLYLHSYGPTNYIGSIHVEVHDTMSAKELHELSFEIWQGILQEYGIDLTVGIYATSNDEKVVSLRKEISEKIHKFAGVKQMHGFYVNFDKGDISFDVVIDFKHNPEETHKKIKDFLSTEYTNYKFYVGLDVDASD